MDRSWLFAFLAPPALMIVAVIVLGVVNLLIMALWPSDTPREPRHLECVTSCETPEASSGAVSSYAGFSPDSNPLQQAGLAFVADLTSLIQNRMDALVDLHKRTLHEGRITAASGAGAFMGITEEAWSVIAMDALDLVRRSQSRKADRIVQRAEADARSLVAVYARQAEYVRAKSNYAKEASMTTEQSPPERSYPLESAAPPFASTVPAHGLKLRSEASPEETQLLNSVEIQRMQILAENFLTRVASMSTEDIARFIQEGGFQLTYDSQQLLEKAKGCLSPEHFALYKPFSDGALTETLTALRGLRSLGHANIREIVATLPSYQSLPEEKQSFIQLLFGRRKE